LSLRLSFLSSCSMPLESVISRGHCYSACIINDASCLYAISAQLISVGSGRVTASRCST
jgi:hypothetical protein